MSGGTDSSVAAISLLEAGYEVTGVTFHFHEPDGSAGYLEDARELARRLGIRHLTRDAREAFRKEIVDYFAREYMAGRTPMPCTLCNTRLKWPLLTRIADEEGIYHVATGHYARLVSRDGLRYVASAADPDKDQTFFLWGLGQETLRRALLPMGETTKREARLKAAARGFGRIAEKRDSIGVCFCPMDYRGFLKAWVEKKGEPWERAVGRGRFVDEEGRFLGRHEGYPFYTVGQRRGLGVYFNRAVFVKETRPERNEVVLASLSALAKSEMLLTDWNAVDPERLMNDPGVTVKIRYRKQENRCEVTLTADGLLRVALAEPLTAVAPGQAAAFYKDGLLLGGGIIVDSR